MIAMLGDLKGVKSLIKQNNIKLLTERVTIINELFAKAFLKEKNRSRSLSCYSFSDSILSIWKSEKEGRSYALEFASNLYKNIEAKGFPYRIYVDNGTEFNDMDNIGNFIASDEKRFMKLFPVSISIWSIFMAENSKFPNGVFIGNDLIRNVSEDEVFVAGDFKYIKIL